MLYLIESKDGVFVNGYAFLPFAKNMNKNIGKNICKSLSSKYSPDMLDTFKNCFQKAIQKTKLKILDLIINVLSIISLRFIYFSYAIIK